MTLIEEHAGLIMGRYRLGRRLGAGGFGAVHEAFDETLDRHVAVKVIPSDGSTPVRARREAVAAARLEHPGIVAIYDAGEEDGARYLVSELVEGRTLAQLEADDQLTDRDVLRVGLALCDALEHAHERGVVHRDVKPQNVLVPDRPRTWRGAAKLADFGVAHLVDGDSLTVTGDVVGTFAYMAPEQAAGKRVDHRTDLYALGLVVYEALAGVNPVRGASPAATARNLGRPVPSLGKHRDDLPPTLVTAVDTALKSAPPQRGTLADLADALEDALTQVDDEGGVVTRHPAEAPVRIPRQTARAAHALLTAALVGGATGWLAPAAQIPWAVAGGAAFALALLFPRLGWIAATAGTAAALLLTAGGTPAPGGSLIVLAAVLPVPLLLMRAPRAWSVAVLAPALGLLSVAGAFPALAGQARGVLERSALGALGAWWLLLADPANQRLGPAADAIAARFTGGEAILLAIWAVAAAILPWIVRGRYLVVDVVAAASWTAALASATSTLAIWLGRPEPAGLVAAAILAGVIAVVAPRYWWE
ncbi:MAG: serine/threonine-protein kinase [Solirubrobacteraceae bacterium]